MENKVLVAYASSSGSTQEVAEAVAETLRKAGLGVDLLPMRNVKTLDGYRGIVLGAPIYMFHLHKDVRSFLGRHQKALVGGMPAAVFAGGPFGNATEKDWQGVRDSVQKELAQFPWFKPACVEIVGGRFDPAKLRFPYNLIPAMRNMPPSVGTRVSGGSFTPGVSRGGFGSLGGAVIASLLIGELQSFGVLLFPNLSMALVYLLMVAVLIIKPSGLFGEE